uniref:Uncharacterized protein n=1 Tax=Leersia perrieri TaxID=77586 RepID=A0A0D9WNM5_9ORYZ
MREFLLHTDYLDARDWQYGMQDEGYSREVVSKSFVDSLPKSVTTQRGEGMNCPPQMDPSSDWCSEGECGCGTIKESEHNNSCRSGPR